MTNILVLAAGAQLVQTVSSMPDHHVTVVDHDQVIHLARPEHLDALLRLGGDFVPEIVILGDDIPIGESLSIGQMLDSALPQIELMLVAEPDTDLALRAMRVGIREIFSPSIGEDELKVLLHRAADNISNRLKPYLVADEAAIVESKVIVVLSAKGGVGKSMVAANLAVGLAKAAPMETVLVDLDIQFGDAATLLDLRPTHSIADAFSSSGALDTLVLKTFLTVYPGLMYVLAGADSPTVGDHVTAAHVKRLIEQLSSQFRYVVIDTGAGLSEHTLAALEDADEVVLVTSMDVSSIRAVRKEIDLLTELTLLPASRHVVLNMTDRHSGLTVKDVESVVGMPVSVSLPRSEEVVFAGNAGKPVMLASKPGLVAKALTPLVGRLVSAKVSEPVTGRGRRGSGRGKKRNDRSS